jgi:hypothetical protein
LEAAYGSQLFFGNFVGTTPAWFFNVKRRLLLLSGAKAPSLHAGSR